MQVSVELVTGTGSGRTQRKPRDAPLVSSSAGKDNVSATITSGSSGELLHNDEQEAESWEESRPAPIYPEIARQRGWSGQVIVMFRTNRLGYPEDVQLEESSGYMVLDEAAIETVRHWRMRPLSSFSVPILFRFKE